jgi:glycine C-acetyltransferase
MYDQFKPFLVNEIASIKEAGLFKKERIITSAQAAQITIQGGREVLNFCANNYLGLSSHPKVIEAAKAAIDSHGFGLSSVRFICGTQDIHKTLEQKISEFLGTEFYMLQHLMPMVVYLSLCLVKKMRSFQMHSIMLPL